MSGATNHQHGKLSSLVAHQILKKTKLVQQGSNGAITGRNYKEIFNNKLLAVKMDQFSGPSKSKITKLVKLRSVSAVTDHKYNEVLIKKEA